MDYDKTKLPETYAKSRQLSAETVALWMDAVAEFLLPDGRPAGIAGEQLTILDLGCGTGRFTVPLAERFDAKVIGVEPSEKMRRQAESDASHPRVAYLAGCAEAIPCEDASFDAAFLSMVVHHFEQVPAACKEIARVLREGGHVFVRNAFSGRLDSIPFYHYFPTVIQAENDRLQRIDELCASFEASVFAKVAHRVITQRIDPSLRAHYERIKLRSLSTFELISAEEFREGIEAMRKAAEAEIEPKPVMEDIDLLVFRK